MVDGNERAAWASAITFLEINGYCLNDPFDADATEDMICSAAQNHLNLETIAVTLAKFTARR